MNKKTIKIIWLTFTTLSFIWIIPFSIVWFLEAYYSYGVFGLTESIIALVCINLFAPWRYPDTKLWKLLIPPYIFFVLSIMFLLYVYTGFDSFSQIQYGIWLIPCLVPFFILGYKTWNWILKRVSDAYPATPF